MYFILSFILLFCLMRLKYTSTYDPPRYQYVIEVSTT